MSAAGFLLLAVGLVAAAMAAIVVTLLLWWRRPLDPAERAVFEAELLDRDERLS